MKNWLRFERSGHSTNNFILRKLWRVSRILGGINPFGDEIKNLTNPQMDFILRMYSDDHPDELKMTDPDILRGEAAPQLQVEWFNVLRGKAAMEFARSPAAFLQKYYGWEKK